MFTLVKVPTGWTLRLAAESEPSGAFEPRSIGSVTLILVNLCVDVLSLSLVVEMSINQPSLCRGISRLFPLSSLPFSIVQPSVSHSHSPCLSLPSQAPAMRAASVAGLVLASLAKLANAEDLLFYDDMLYNEYKEATTTLGYTGVSIL